VVPPLPSLIATAKALKSFALSLMPSCHGKSRNASISFAKKTTTTGFITRRARAHGFEPFPAIQKMSTETMESVTESEDIEPIASDETPNGDEVSEETLSETCARYLLGIEALQVSHLSSCFFLFFLVEFVVQVFLARAR
jgi:hypothetical protein